MSENHRLPVMYHVTLIEHVESILAEGLIPQLGNMAKDCGETKKAIWLFPDRESVETALSSWLGEELEARYGEDCETAIIAIHLPESFSSSLRYNADIGYEVVCDSPIPAVYLQILDGSFNPLPA